MPIVVRDRAAPAARSGSSILRRITMLAIGLTAVTTWLGCELVYQVRLSLDDDGGVVPFPERGVAEAADPSR